MAILFLCCGGSNKDTSGSSVVFSVAGYSDCKVSYIGNAIVVTMPVGVIKPNIVIQALQPKFTVTGSPRAQCTFTPVNSGPLLLNLGSDGSATLPGTYDLSRPATFRVPINGTPVTYTIYVFPSDLTIAGSAGLKWKSPVPNDTTYPPIILFSDAFFWRQGHVGQLDINDANQFATVTGVCGDAQNNLCLAGYSSNINSSSNGYWWPMPSDLNSDPGFIDKGHISGHPISIPDQNFVKTGPICFENGKTTIAVYTAGSTGGKAYVSTSNAMPTSSTPFLKFQMPSPTPYLDLQIGGLYTSNDSNSTVFAFGSYINNRVPGLISWATPSGNPSSALSPPSIQPFSMANHYNINASCTNNSQSTFNNVYVGGSLAIDAQLKTITYPFYCTSYNNKTWTFIDLSQGGNLEGSVQSIACDSSGTAYMVGYVINAGTSLTMPCCWIVPINSNPRPNPTYLSTDIGTGPTNTGGGKAMTVTANGPIPYIGGYVIDRHNIYHPCLWTGVDTNYYVAAGDPVLDLTMLVSIITGDVPYDGGTVTALWLARP
jgi:hypothetical protein